MSYPAILLLHEEHRRDRAEEKHLDLNLLLTAMACLGKGGEKAVKSMFAQLEAMMSDHDASTSDASPDQAKARRDSLTARLLQFGAGLKN